MALLTATEIAALSTPELLKYFNEHSGSAPVKKFSDRKTAERRVLALVGLPASTAPSNVLAPEPAKAVPKPSPAATKTLYVKGRRVTADKPLKAAKKVEKKAAVKVKAKAQQVDLSEAQRIAWQDPAVRESRSERSSVSVNGKDYRSVRAAFEALGLPMSQHIGFRGRLKEAGKLTEYGKKWEIVPLNY